MSLENVGLLDVDVLVVGQHRTRREPHQRRHQAGRAIEQQRLGLATGEAGLLPLHTLGTNEVANACLTVSEPFGVTASMAMLPLRLIFGHP